MTRRWTSSTERLRPSTRAASRKSSASVLRGGITRPRPGCAYSRCPFIGRSALGAAARRVGLDQDAAAGARIELHQVGVVHDLHLDGTVAQDERTYSPWQDDGPVAAAQVGYAVVGLEARRGCHRGPPRLAGQVRPP